MSATHVSLVIPTYNRAELISETIQSAIDQTTKFYEIIVVDDGSTDNTGQVLNRYGNAIKYIKTNNHGVQAARNAGIAAAASEIVVLCDSDDLLEANYLESVAPWMIENASYDILFTNFATFNQKEIQKDKLSRCPFDFLFGAKMHGNIATQIPELYKRSIEYQPLFPSGMMFRKSFAVDIGGYKMEFNGVGAEDWEFTLRAISLGNVAICTAPLIRIRKHEGNDSGDALKMSLGEVRILEHALIHHAAARQYKVDILKSIEQRRYSAFNIAYAAGKFDIAHDVAKRIKTTSKPNIQITKFLIKKGISNLPEKLRDLAWKATQKRGIK